MVLSQDFQKVIQVVGELESSLKQMIKKEQADRKKDVDSLQVQVKDLQSDKKRTDDIVISAAKVNIRFDTLEEEVAKINSGIHLGTLSVQDDLLVKELKKTIEEAKTVTKLAAAPTLSSIKVGVLSQVQGQLLQEQTTAAQDTTPDFTRHWQRQMFVRRMRVIVGGDISKNTTFFFESDATSIGKVGATGSKTINVNMYVQDAFIQYTFMPEVSIITGLQLVGITRNSLQSAASLMALNYGSYQFVPNVPLDNIIGRDVGVSARGFLLNERLEYRIGVFDGKSFNPYSSLRTTARVAYSFGDLEKGIFYSGTTLGKGHVLSVGTGADIQGSYSAYAGDVFVDMPVSDLGSVTGSVSLSLIDGGGSSTDSTYFTGQLPRQTVYFAEVGFYLKEYGLQPYLKYEAQSVNATVLKQVGATDATLSMKNSLKSESRLGIGLNYFIQGHSVNLKALYETVLRNRVSLVPAKTESASNGEFTLQLQYFMY